MQARTGIFEAQPHRPDEVVALFHDKITPAFSRHEGCIGCQAFIGRESGHFVWISLWPTKTALEAGTAID